MTLLKRAQDLNARLTRKLARGEGMGAWDGEEHFWPELHDFNFEGDKFDRFGDAYKATYQYVSRGDGYIDLFVDFEATDFVASSGTQAGEWSARSVGETRKGTWKTIDSIGGILRDLVKWAESVHKAAEQTLKKVGGPKWTVDLDGVSLTATFKSDDRSSDAWMTVTFEDVEDVIFRSGASAAEIHYAAGSDYGGHFGERHERRIYRSLQDIDKVLKEAETLWKRWRKD